MAIGTSLKVLMRFSTIVRPIGFRYLLWPGQPRQRQICFDGGMTAVSGRSVFLDHVGAFFRGHNDGRIDVRGRHGWKN